MPYYTYILYSASHKVYYKGMTANIEKRLWQHNQGFSRYTKNKGPWQLVYCKPFPTKKEALMAEKKLKKAGSDYLQKCIRDYQSKP